MTDLLQTVFFVFFAGLLGTVLIGALSRDLQAAVNGVASVVAAALPTLSEFAIASRSGAAVAFGLALSAWIAVAGFRIDPPPANVTADGRRRPRVPLLLLSGRERSAIHTTPLTGRGDGKPLCEPFVSGRPHRTESASLLRRRRPRRDGETARLSAPVTTETAVGG